MGYYDNFSKQRLGITKIGKTIISYRNRFFLKKLLSYISPNSTLLEIGPGKGEFLELCVNNNINNIGVEGSRSLHSSLENRGYKVYYQYVPPIEIEESQIDVVYMNQVFEHMQNIGMAQQLLTECRNILNKNGLILIACPEIKFWKEDFFASDYTHNYPTSLTNVSQILFDQKFEILAKGYYTLWFENTFICAIISMLTRFVFGLGLFNLLLGKRAYKIKTVLLPSFYILAQKNGK